METQSKNKARLDSLVIATNKFYASDWSLVFYLTVTTIFAILQIILFYTGVLTINGEQFGVSEGAEKAFWIATSVSIFGCYVGFISGVLSVRGSLYFLPFATVQMFCSIAVSVLARGYFLAFSMIASMVVFYARFFIWKGGYLEKWNLQKKHWLPYCFIALGIMLMIGYLIVGFYGESMYNSTADGLLTPGMVGYKPSWTWYFDVTSCMLVIIASIAFTLKSRWSYILYIVSKIFSFAIYAQQGNIVPIVQLVLFAMMDITGFLSWSVKSINIPE